MLNSVTGGLARIMLLTCLMNFYLLGRLSARALKGTRVGRPPSWGFEKRRAAGQQPIEIRSFPRALHVLAVSPLDLRL